MIVFTRPIILQFIYGIPVHNKGNMISFCCFIHLLLLILWGNIVEIDYNWFVVELKSVNLRCVLSVLKVSNKLMQSIGGINRL